MAEYIAAIDLGTTKIVTAIGKLTENGKLQILAFHEQPSAGINRGEVQNIQEVVSKIKPTIEEVRRQSGINFSEVFVGIAGQHIYCKEYRGDILRNDYEIEISEEEVQRLQDDMYSIRTEPGEEILHVIPQTYNVDDKMGITNPVGMLGKKLEANFHIIIGKTVSAQHTQRCIDRVGLELKKLMLEPLASARAVLNDDEKEVGVAMVDMGGGTTDLVVYYDGVLRHSAVIPFGGNSITNDIREGCGVLQRYAGEMKEKYGSCFGTLAPENKIIAIPGIGGREAREISFKTLANIIEARMDEIMDAVLYQIERSGYLNKLNAGIVFTGGGSLMRDLPQYVKYKTGLDVRLGYPSMYLSADLGSKLSSPTYSTVIGLLLEGFAYMDQLERKEELNAKNTVGIELDPDTTKVSIEEVEEDEEDTNEVREPKKAPWAGIGNLLTGIFKQTDDDEA